MKFTKLELKNFRCFEHLDIDLHPQLTVLVAKNGQGKSSVLDALRISLWPFVSSFDLATNAFNDSGNAIAIGDVRLIQMEDGDMARQLPSIVAMTGDFGIGYETKWIRYRDKEAKQTKTKDDGNTQLMRQWASAVQVEIFGVGHETKWIRYRNKEAKNTKTTNGGDTELMRQWASAVQVEIRDPNLPAIDLPVFGYYGTGRLHTQKKPTQTSRGKDDTRETDFYIRTFAYLNCLDPNSSYKHFEEWFILASEVYLEAVMNNRDGREPESTVETAEAPLQVVRQAIDSLLKPSTGWHHLEYSYKHQKSLVLHHEQHGTLKVWMLSDGIRSVLAMMGDIAYRAYKLNPHLKTEAARKARGVVLIDEIDMHLHPSWQQHVLGQLQEAFPNIQFIVTTHSPQVLTSVDASCVRLLEEELDPETGVQKTRVKRVTLQTKGVASSDVLSQIMGVSPIPPVEEAVWFTDYTAKIENGTHEDEDGLLLRKKLENHFGPQHPLMLDANRLIRFQAFKLRKKSTPQD